MKDPGTFACDHCGEVQPLDERALFDGRQLCLNCLAERTIFCECCGERIWVENNAGDSSTPLCQDCYDDHYTTCTRCGEVIRRSEACYRESDEDEDYPYCPAWFAALPQDS